MSGSFFCGSALFFGLGDADNLVTCIFGTGSKVLYECGIQFCGIYHAQGLFGDCELFFLTDGFGIDYQRGNNQTIGDLIPLEIVEQSLF